MSLLGTVGALATVPAAIALLLSAAGRGVTELGRRLGWAGTLLAGRWTQGRPGYLSRLVAGVVIALGLLSVVQVYPSMHSASVQGALAMRERFGYSILTVQMPHGAADRTGAWVEKLPPGAEVAVLDSTLGLANGAGEVKETQDGPVEVRQAVTVRGSCDALRGLGLAVARPGNALGTPPYRKPRPPSVPCCRPPLHRCRTPVRRRRAGCGERRLGHPALHDTAEKR
ncbi:hypothetical protein [Streptomyces sp900116325]|uniref:hypothetical protein n=1 Tax=Streptomyces sp. 900116325 TaxID=3154295 RepID=UPI0033B369AC